MFDTESFRKADNTMNTSVAMIILAEVALFLFLVYGFLHEDKFIAFEDKAIAVIRHNIKLRKQRKAAIARRKLNDKVRYTPERPVRAAADGDKVA